MEKQHIYIDETYNLQKENQYYALAGYTTTKPEIIKLEYKKLLKKLKFFGNEIKSTDRHSIKIREKLCKTDITTNNISYVGIFQEKMGMNYAYYKQNINEQEICLYKELLKILLNKIVSEDDNNETSFIIIIDKNNKIKEDYFKDLKKELSEKTKEANIIIEMKESKDLINLQLADQIAGIVRENKKNGDYKEFIKTFKIFEENPLS